MQFFLELATICVASVQSILMPADAPCRFWDQVNEDVEALCKRATGYEGSADEENKEKALVSDPFLRQLVSQSRPKVASDLAKLEKELEDEATAVEKALAKRSGRLQAALAHLLQLISSGDASPSTVTFALVTAGSDETWSCQTSDPACQTNQPCTP